MIRRIIEKPAEPGPGADEGAVPRNVRLSKYPAEPRTWCLTALQPLFLRRGAPRPPPQNAGQPRGRGASSLASPCSFVEEHHVLHSKVPGSPGGVVPHCPPALISSSASTTSSAPKCRAAPGRGASLPSSPYFFVEEHHILHSKMPTGPGGVVPHCPPALISSSRSTTSSPSKCRPSPGTWCLTALQPLFLRRQAPRPPLQSAGQPRGRGASLPASPYFFVGRHHVLRSKVPGSPGGVVLHPSLTLVPSSASTTSSTPKCRAAPGAWCLTALQPLFLRPQAPRLPLQSAGQPRGRGASSLASPCSDMLPL